MVCRLILVSEHRNQLEPSYLGLSNIYLYTRCSNATNMFTITIKFSIKNLLAKTSFFVAEGKGTEGQRKNTPTAAPCGLAPTQSSHQVTGASCFHILSTPSACPPPKRYARRASTYASGDRRSRIGRLEHPNSKLN